jgi:hypothetical protein
VETIEGDRVTCTAVESGQTSDVQEGTQVVFTLQVVLDRLEE